jgi:hypothetical protein
LNDDPQTCEPAGAPLKGARAERPILGPMIAVVVGFVLFAALTVGYVSWSVSASQHTWCATINLLNEAPAPATAKGPPAPARVYDQHLAADFRTLKEKFRC